MNVPPLVLDLRVVAPERRPVHLWLPLFLLWPLFLALGVLALVLTVVTDVVLFLLGQRYHHTTILLLRSFEALCETRGMVIRVNGDETTVDMTVK